MNLPNKLTMLRMALAVVFLLFMHLPGVAAKVITLVIFTVAALTDWLDGRIAKSQNMVTDFGKFMDPLADKVLVFSAFLSFLWMQLIAVWMVMAIIAREMIITGLRIFALSRGEVLAASKGGKHKTVSQMVAIFIILFSLIYREAAKNYLLTHPQIDRAIEASIYLAMLSTVILTLISGASYFWNNRHLFYNNKG